MWAMLAQMMTIIMDGMTKAIVTWDQTQEGCQKVNVKAIVNFCVFFNLEMKLTLSIGL